MMKVYIDIEGSLIQYETYRAPDYKTVSNPDYDPEIEGSEETIKEEIPYVEERAYVEMPDNTDLSKMIVAGGVLRDMTSEELLSIANEEAAVVIKEQIAGLELTVTARRIREATLTTEGKDWLQNVDDQIAELRANL